MRSGNINSPSAVSISLRCGYSAKRSDYGLPIITYR